MNKDKVACGSCGNEKEQILIDIDLEGGHRVDWSNRTEWDFARALLYMVCRNCGCEYTKEIEWKGDL